MLNLIHLLNLQNCSAIKGPVQFSNMQEGTHDHPQSGHLQLPPLLDHISRVAPNLFLDWFREDSFAV